MNPYGIQLRQPLPGDIIGNKITIAAIGTAFEASYGWHLVNGDTTVDKGYFQGGSMGSLESFVHQADVSTDYSGRAVLRVFGDDPSGESEGTDLVEIPVVVLAGVTGYPVHQVMAEETLTRLAEQYNSTVDNIVLANSLADPDRIRVGQVLRIPV
ncbi:MULTISPECIES: LysM peptidoglycan-binding domain-containing protein [unclassified Blastococcus]|uniref:LysM peptidoglycan-binding domain-containing protein n=1 Tax=unclassified Blastococcus TaxID=2619396 RepID=UPI001EF0F44A|nr:MULTISPECIES: LysM peptidoglycan-binding domain-containing protein [unclassified Blastococcus]